MQTGPKMSNFVYMHIFIRFFLCLDWKNMSTRFIIEYLFGMIKYKSAEK